MPSRDLAIVEVSWAVHGSHSTRLHRMGSKTLRRTLQVRIRHTRSEHELNRQSLEKIVVGRPTRVAADADMSDIDYRL